MEEQLNICGFAVIENECPNYEIKDIGILDFQVRFIDELGQLFASMNKPKIEVSLFDLAENHQLGVAIIPNSISNLKLISNELHDLTFRIVLSTSKVIKLDAYGEILNLVKLSVNFLQILCERRGLTYSSNLGITNSNTSTLTVTIKKRI